MDGPSSLIRQRIQAMQIPSYLTAMLVGLAAIPAAADAQMSAPPIPSALPNVQAMTPANSAGVLEYCSKRHLVSTVSAGAVLGSLTKKGSVKKSVEYTAGQSGQILTGHGKPFVVGKAPSYLQSRVCDMVLNHAKQF